MKRFNLKFIISFVIALLVVGSAAVIATRAEKKASAVEETIASKEQAVEEIKTELDNLKESNKKKEADVKAAEEESAKAEAVQKEKGAQEAKQREDNAEVTATPAPTGVETKENGHIVAIDPGHQGEWVDMSATEPNGPGSSTMKARCSTGTSGSYSNLAEYQLNLDVSLKLQKVLEDRGYQVVMTRTDNDVNISNAERATLASESGAEIYVRVHANGDDSGTVSGALSMSPSPDNPYVANLYEESNRLSTDVVNAYCAATGFSNLGVQYYDDMTGINWSKIPVTIIEMGFMTSEHDDLAMAQDDFQYTMAQGIADGVDAYFLGQ